MRLSNRNKHEQYEKWNETNSQVKAERLTFHVIINILHITRIILMHTSYRNLPTNKVYIVHFRYMQTGDWKLETGDRYYYYLDDLQPQVHTPLNYFLNCIHVYVYVSSNLASTNVKWNCIYKTATAHIIYGLLFIRFRPHHNHMHKH